LVVLVQTELLTGAIVGKLIYFVSYGIAVAAIFIAKHAACGIYAARHRAEPPRSVAHVEEDVTERLLLDLEQVILEMISAARANDLHMLHERGREQMAILKTLEQESTWSSERVAKHLSDRGWGNFNTPEFQELRARFHEAERTYGKLAA
jgi:hypothetical protein